MPELNLTHKDVEKIKAEIGCEIDNVLQNHIPCQHALRRLNIKGVRGEKLDKDICPWYVNSPKHYYCFWIYILDPGNEKEHQLTEIAKLLGTSVNNIKLIENNTIQKLKENLHHLKEFQK